MSLGAKYLVAITFQIAVLFYLVALSEWGLSQGQTVLLAVESHETPHPMGGQIRQTRLAISVLGAHLLRDPRWQPRLGDKVCVLLEEGPGGHIAVEYLVRRKRLSELSLIGRVTGITPEQITVDYGLDHFTAPSRANGDLPDCKLAVRVRSDGSAMIEELLVDGQPYDDWNRRDR